MRKIFFLILSGIPFLIFGQAVDSIAMKTVDSLLQVSRSLMVQGDFEKALDVNSEVEKITLAKWGRESARYGTACFSHGRILYFQGVYPESEKWYLDSKSIREKVLGVAHPDYAWCLNNLAILYSDMGDNEKAEPLYLEAMDIRKKAFGRLNKDYASSLNNLGVLYRDMANFEKAEPFFLEAVDIRKQLNGEKSPSYANYLDNLAILYMDMGNYEKAEPLYLQAKDIREKALGKMDQDYASSLNNLGIFYFNIGNNKKAEPLYLEAKAIRAKVLGEEHPKYLITLNNLANLYETALEYKKAESLYIELLGIREKVLGKEHVDYAGGLQSLAILYTDMGAYKQAEPLYLEAKDIREKVQGVSHPEYAGILNNLANLYTNAGDFGKAGPLYLQSKSIRKSVLGTAHSAYAEILDDLANYYWLVKDYSAAESTLMEAGKAEKKLLINASRHLSEQELSFYVHKFNNALNRNLSFVPVQPDFASFCYDDILFYKGFLLNSVSQIGKLASTDLESTQKFNIFKSYERRLSDEYAKPLADQKNVPELQEKANSMEKDLVRSVAGLGEVLRQVDWKEVQQNLHPNEAAIEFVRYHLIHPQPTDSIMYAALVLKSGASQPVFIPLFEEKKLDKLLQNRGKAKAEFINDLYTATPTQSLYQLIWQPLEQQLTGIKTIYFSPAGLLYRLNPGAIIAPPLLRGNEERETIASRYHLVELGSTRQLAFPSTTAPNGSSAVLYGGIQYDLDSIAITHAISDLNANSLLNPRGLSFSNTDSTLRGGTWDYLKWTDIEVTATAALLNDAGLQPAVRRGSVATEESFKTIGIGHPSPRILHIATHGFFFPDPENKGQRAISNQQEPVFKSSDHPMIRSGLILAGGNYAWQKGKPYRSDREDGILTAYEISQMNLRNTELVVLSACETGLGDIQGNEGVYGLQRAFKIAGVKYLIMSLWQVPDFQTQELMAAFYNKWLMEKMTIPEAFSAAQNAMREKYKDPLLWAGFILVE